MKKKWAGLVLCVAVVAGVICLMFYPRHRISQLSQELSDARTPGEVAVVVRKLLEYGNKTAIEVVATYAEQRHLCCFNRKHQMFLIHEDSSGDVYTVDKRASERSAIGDPPRIFSGAHCAESTKDRLYFVLKDKNQNSFMSVQMKFEGGKLAGEGIANVSEEQLLRWKSDSSWPSSWR